LIACFLGFGTGCYLANRRINLLAMLVPLIALAVICELPSPALREVRYQLPYMVGMISQVDIWGVPSVPVNAATLIMTAAAVLFVVPIFGLIALVFIPIGQLVGWYLENATDGISGYTINILGSLVGIALYTLLCFLWLPPRSGSSRSVLCWPSYYGSNPGCAGPQ